jgi:HEAT repeat protein
VLGQLSDRRAVDPLAAALQTDQESSVRSAAARSLGRLFEGLRAKDSRVKNATSWSQTRKELQKARQDPVPEVRNAAMEALESLGESLDVLLPGLEDSDPDTRARAAQAVAKLAAEQDNPSVVQKLLAIALHDDEEKVREQVIASLKRYWAGAAADQLTPLLQRKPDESRWPLLFRPIIRIFSKDRPKETGQDVWTRKRVVEALGHLGGSQVVEALVNALEDPEPSIRREVIKALGKLAALRALDPILKRLKAERERDVRIQIADTLALLGDPKAVDPLLAAWKGEVDGEARRHLEKAIKLLSPQKAEQMGIK